MKKIKCHHCDNMISMLIAKTTNGICPDCMERTGAAGKMAGPNVAKDLWEAEEMLREFNSLLKDDDGRELLDEMLNESLTSSSNRKTKEAKFNELRDADLPTSEAIDLVAQWVAADCDPAEGLAWNELKAIDWSPDVNQVDKWFQDSIKALKDLPAIHYLYIHLGSCPEAFYVSGCSFFEGQKTVDAIMEDVARDQWNWTDNFQIQDADSWYTEVGEDHRVHELPVMREVFNLNSEDNTYPSEEKGGSLLWEIIALLGAWQSMRRMKLDFDAILGPARRTLPVFMGFTDCWTFCGILSRDGWNFKVDGEDTP